MSESYSLLNNNVGALEPVIKLTVVPNGSTNMSNNQQNIKDTVDNSRQPLLGLDNKLSAPLARIEVDEDSDERDANKPYPGVDDGFFDKDDGMPDNNNKPIDPKDDLGNPDVEFVPVHPKEPEPTAPSDGEFPDIFDRMDPGDGNDGTDQNDGKPTANIPKSGPPFHDFPISPGYRPGVFDIEVGSNPGGESIPDLNVYQHKKTLAQGMMDLALFSANANQLRYVLETFKTHPYYYPSLVLISISLFLQVAVGIGLIWNATYNVKDEKALCRANKINNFTIIAIFLVTVINVFISAFGVAQAPS